MNLKKNDIKAVILDWAGTAVDYGSRAPTQVFIEIFRQRGIEITPAEARGPMGRTKIDHIACIMHEPRVAELWRQKYDRDATMSDIEAMYHDFLPLQKSTLATMGCDPLPGIPEAIANLRARGLKIGSTTGYTRELMDVVVPRAAEKGYSPDVVICSDDVPAGRPAPWMNFLAAQKLGVYPLSSILIVDDTPVGIEAAVNAGAIAIGVSQSGNALGLSEEEVAALPSQELTTRLQQIETAFRDLGAPATLPSVADLPAWIDSLPK